MCMVVCMLDHLNVHTYMQMENSGVIHMLKTSKTEGMFVGIHVWDVHQSHFKLGNVQRFDRSPMCINVGWCCSELHVRSKVELTNQSLL